MTNTLNELIAEIDGRVLIVERAENGEGLSYPEPSATEIGCAREDLGELIFDNWSTLRARLRGPDGEVAERVAQAAYTGWVTEHGFPNGLPTWDELPDNSAKRLAADPLCKLTWRGVAEFASHAALEPAAWRPFKDFMREHRLKDPDELERLKWMEAIAVVPNGKPSRLPVRYRGHPDYGWFVLDSGKPCEVLFVREPLPQPADEAG